MRAIIVATNETAVNIRPGDLNRDGRVDRTDLAQLIDELFDGDGSDAANAAGGRVASGAEADANGDSAITGADIPGLLRRATR